MTRRPWFDPETGELVFPRDAEQRDSWRAAMAEGAVTPAALRAQQERVADLLRRVEPLVPDEAHAPLTEALAEVAVLYGLQSIHLVQQLRPAPDETPRGPPRCAACRAELQPGAAVCLSCGAPADAGLA